MITERHANECIMINERHKAYDELQGIGAYITSPRRPAGVLVREKTAKKNAKLIKKNSVYQHGFFVRKRKSAHDSKLLTQEKKREA